MSRLRRYKKGEDTKLTKNFSSTEFDCKCSFPECEWTTLDLDHVDRLQEKRIKWKKPIKITSAFRCPRYNKLVGGATQSQHPLGTATDIQVEGKSINVIQKDCESFDGLGCYDTFTHVDSRGTKARWNFRKKK